MASILAVVLMVVVVEVHVAVVVVVAIVAMPFDVCISGDAVVVAIFGAVFIVV